MSTREFQPVDIQYLKIISGKTAALFEASFLLSGIPVRMRQSGKKCIQKAGRYLGMIFQLTDDCLDFEAADDDVGKPVLSDLKM